MIVVPLYQEIVGKSQKLLLVLVGAVDSPSTPARSVL
jgi:hypothetical protein